MGTGPPLPHPLSRAIVLVDAMSSSRHCSVPWAAIRTRHWYTPSTAKRSVVGVDLETRRVRPYMEQVRYAAVGPDGALYAVDTGSAVIQLARRTTVRFRSKLQGTPEEMFGTMNGALLARVGGTKSALEAPGSDQPPASTPLPATDRSPRASMATSSRSLPIPPSSSTIRWPNRPRASSGCPVMRET